MFLKLVFVFAIGVVGLALFMHVASVDLRAPPEWATQIVLGACAFVCAASAWFVVGAVASFLRQPQSFGRDELVVAILIAAVAAGWSGRGAALIADGRPAADALGLTAARGIWAVRVDGDVLRVAGDITPRLADRIITDLDENPDVRVLAIDSPGGRLDAAIEIADAVRARGLDIHVPSACASACLTILVAGNRRIAGPQASIGCHQPSHALTGESIGPFGAFPEYAPPREAADQHRRVVAACNATPPESMLFISLADLARIGAITHIGRNDATAAVAGTYCARRPFDCARSGR